MCTLSNIHIERQIFHKNNTIYIYTYKHTFYFCATDYSSAHKYSLFLKLLMQATYPSKTFIALSLKLSIFPVFISRTAIIINRQNSLVCNSNTEDLHLLGFI